MWYRKVLQFLPVGLQRLAEESAACGNIRRQVVQMPLEWQVRRTLIGFALRFSFDKLISWSSRFPYSFYSFFS
jgi:hypothetical protein